MSALNEFERAARDLIHKAYELQENGMNAATFWRQKYVDLQNQVQYLLHVVDQERPEMSARMRQIIGAANLVYIEPAASEGGEE
jgi:flagellar biosynthesis regulator FlbT